MIQLRKRRNQNSMKDEKRDYLIKTLSRTKRKDYENYIVNGIYHRLNRLDIQPVTQQHVLRSDGKRALIDLYFPQLNYGVECDEAYHLGNYEHDITREITMEEMLSTIKESESFILRRVPAYESIEMINESIESIVEEIHSLVEERNIEPWNYGEDAIAQALSKGTLSIEDGLSFTKIIDICRCFGKEYKGMQRSYFNIGNDHYLWCPKLAIESTEGPKSIANGWINTLSDDWEYIYETNDDVSKVEKLPKDKKRATFAKSKDVLGRNVYRFVGVFSHSPELSSKGNNVYIRISEEINLTEWR